MYLQHRQTHRCEGNVLFNRITLSSKLRTTTCFINTESTWAQLHTTTIYQRHCLQATHLGGCQHHMYLQHRQTHRSEGNVLFNQITLSTKLRTTTCFINTKSTWAQLHTTTIYQRHCLQATHLGGCQHMYLQHRQTHRCEGNVLFNRITLSTKLRSTTYFINTESTWAQLHTTTHNYHLLASLLTGNTPGRLPAHVPAAQTDT
jgi:coproporphyrinogen III oxidase